MPDLFGDSELLDAIEDLNLQHRHIDTCAAETLASSDNWVYPSNMELYYEQLKSETTLFELENDNLTDFMLNSGEKCTSFYTPSEDIWKKFDLGLIDQDISEEDLLFDIHDDNDLIQKLSSSLESLNSPREIRHDCMWSGKCLNERHEKEDRLTPPLSPLKQPLNKPVNSRSLLNPQRFNQKQSSKSFTLKSYFKPARPETKMAINKIVRERMHGKLDSEGEEHRPDTPVSDIDEHVLFATGFDDEQSISDSEYDSDNTQNRQRDGFVNDHSYHIVRSSSVSPNSNKTEAVALTDSLGVQTPSDSEEEIDVVSVGVCPLSETSCSRTVTKSVPIPNKKYNSKAENSRLLRHATNLPTNPSPSDKHSLQLTMAAAVGKRHTATPVRNRAVSNKKNNNSVPEPANNENDAGDTSSTESIGSVTAPPTPKRGVKRTRVHRRAGAAAKDYDSSNSNNASPRKRSTTTSRSSSDSEDSGKRTMHNTMERQRRVDLRNAFEGLRILIPKLTDVEKAPKVHILKEAGCYCRYLETVNDSLKDRRKKLEERQKELKNELSHLRRSLSVHYT